MEEKEPAEGEELVVAMGLTGGRKSKYILRWALDKFMPEGNLSLKLLHVYSKITSVPTPMGSYVAISQVREDVALAYRMEIEYKKKKALLLYQQILKEKKVKSEIVMVESDDIAMGLSLAVARLGIRHLVIGVSSTSIFSRKMTLRKIMGENISASIAENAPSNCSIYVIADGKLQQMRPAESEPTVITLDDTSGLSSVSTDSSSSSSSLTIGRLLKSRPSSPKYLNSAETGSLASNSKHNEPESLARNAGRSKTLARESTERKYFLVPETKGDEYTTNTSFDSTGVVSQRSSSSGSWISDRASPRGLPTSSLSDTTPTGSFAGTPPTSSFFFPPTPVSLPGTPPKGGSFTSNPPGTPPKGGSFTSNPPQHGSPSGSVMEPSLHQTSELEQLKLELRHMQQKYEVAQNSDFNEKRVDEALKAKELTSSEKNEQKIAQIRAVDSEERAQRIAARQKEAETAAHEAEARENSVAHPACSYQKFTWNEIVDATSSFSEDLQIGSGAFGTVFKCKLHYTTVAVKVLHSKDSSTNKQFLQELEILSTIRHPHLLLLLGAVPEESCLVYEYMENRSLDDRLFRKDNTPPLPWYDRFRICYEVASALTFLHSTKPSPIIHRDLKPANILLDQNLVSKIGDAGLGTMLNMEPSNKSLKTLYKETSPVGTLCYIDPEYQRTGRVSTKSDIYALGVVILQLLTAKPAVGIAYLIEDALDEGNLEEYLDPEAGEWPQKETLELAMLGLQCAELRGRDRPDLSEKILPTLERLKEKADSARESASSAPTATPVHFICPILKDIMEDPYVAADGYTYDRRAIEQWLTENHTSPTTDELLPHKFIMPNYTLSEAINRWKSSRPKK